MKTVDDEWYVVIKAYTLTVFEISWILRTPKLEVEVRRVRIIDGSPHPLQVIYTYGASASDYTCHPNIH